MLEILPLVFAVSCFVLAARQWVSPAFPLLIVFLLRLQVFHLVLLNLADLIGW
jgi:hypothetical protein